MSLDLSAESAGPQAGCHTPPTLVGPPVWCPTYVRRCCDNHKVVTYGYPDSTMARRPCVAVGTPAQAEVTTGN